MTTVLDETHDPARVSWVESANRQGTDFPIQNLPLGIFSHEDERRRFGIAIGDKVLDVGAAVAHFSASVQCSIRAADDGNLNDLLALGKHAVRDLRREVADLLDLSSVGNGRRTLIEQHLIDAVACSMHLPTCPRNYSDFYAGIHHAQAAGALLTPENPLPANYKWVPIAYHGRASSIRVSHSDVRRPRGQRAPRTEGGSPDFGQSERLDFELEMGFYVGPGNRLGDPVAIDQASDQIMGFSLLNDWSARDIQQWEMFPLGPFLSKSFATFVSPWIITTDALAPFRVSAMQREAGDPEPLRHLFDPADQAHGGVDVKLHVQIATKKMRDHGLAPSEILRSNARYLYWTPAQMLAHHTSNGCNLLPGDLIGTGTISGPTDDQLSSLLELTFGGTRPITLVSGETRAFLANGDQIIITGRCSRSGFRPIGFGECSGTIAA